MTNSRLITLPPLTLSCLLPGVVQLDRMVIEVSPERCWMKQERWRLDPDTRFLLVADTVTTGLGTERKILSLYDTPTSKPLTCNLQDKAVAATSGLVRPGSRRGQFCRKWVWLVTWPVRQGVSANVARGLTF